MLARICNHDVVFCTAWEVQTLALPWMESVAGAAVAKTPALRMAHYYVPIGVVRRAFFPGEADHVIPKGNLGNVMRSLGKQNPQFSVKPLDNLTPNDQAA